MNAMNPSSAPPPEPGSLTAPLIVVYRVDDPIPPVSLVGGKAHNLARLIGAGAGVPPWFSITTEAFRRFVLPFGSLPVSAREAEPWRAAIRNELRLPGWFEDAVRSALHQAGLTGNLLSVRSSGVVEDGVGASYAGQFDTILGALADTLLSDIRAVWASAGNAHALQYGGRVSPLGVIIQKMVDAAASGVAFGADPVSGRHDVAVVSAVYGLGEGLVSGELDADTHLLEFAGGRDTVISVENRIAEKDFAIRLRPAGGTLRDPVPEHLRVEAALGHEEVRRVALQARHLGISLGAPQDVEWAIEVAASGERTLYILQARPITVLGNPADGQRDTSADGERRVWDNSNIVESYAGVTSPLTFSFARSVYEDVYRQFCSLVGIPAEVVDRNRAVFSRMLGQIRGRVYYNLLNWYRVLALLPGFTVNRGFMERMMGVREKLEDDLAPVSDGKITDTARLVRMVYRLGRESRALTTAVPAFHAHMDDVLLPLSEQDLNDWSADRLVRLYRDLEEQILRRWQTPIVNDFFAMIWFGVLSRLVEKWLPDAPATLMNDLLTHEGGMISTEPARWVTKLARQVDGHPELARIFDSGVNEAVLWETVQESPVCAAFRAEVNAYRKRFGDRCMNELKLETITLGEDPAFLLEMIRSYRRSGLKVADTGHESRIRAEAEAIVCGTLPSWKRALLLRVLSSARARVRDRENLRFERTRVFGTVRRIFVGIGHHFVRESLLDEPRDVFFLTIEEIFAHADGTDSVLGLRELVRLRKREWERFEAEAAPPERFESFGPPSLGRWKVAETARDAAAARGDTLSGIGCCPGVVRAPVRTVRDPREAGDLSGRILVAERTDPGWTLLFPAAEGLLVERGSLLSHSAIVAREVGLPCIVSVKGLMNTLIDGEVVEMDGKTGTIRRLSRES